MGLMTPCLISKPKNRTPQPPKLPKQQTTSSTSQVKNPGHLVPFLPSQAKALPVSPTTIANRFLVSTIPKPNYKRPYGHHSYSSALVTPPPKTITLYIVEEPFGPIVPQKPSSHTSRKGRSSYVKKPFIQHISYIKPHLVHIIDPLALPLEVLPQEWHFLPKHPEKNIKFYKSILIQEKSTRIENIMNKVDPSIVLYHKFIITGFVSCKDWGRHPSFLKKLKNLKSLTSLELHYSYYDYMDAFEKVLFYHNKDFDHVIPQFCFYDYQCILSFLI